MCPKNETEVIIDPIELVS